MTSLPPDLLSGYRRFRAFRYREEADSYAALADSQSPRTMIIGCADSRVDPATIFGAAPGELFVVRNVANLVPPCIDTPSDLHGTSAALEFAVTGLGIQNIVVMGHGGCGGVSASLASADNVSVGHFIGPWVELLASSRDRVIANTDLTDPAARQTALEHLGIRQSLENLMSFAFVSEGVAEGNVSLHGAWFSIGNGILHWLNQETGEFETIDA
jgi:carbonic anhydrase